MVIRYLSPRIKCSNVRYTTLLLLLCSLSTMSQTGLIQSGPMLGYSEMREVLLWVQTTEPAEVQMEYWQGETGRIRPFQTESVRTEKASAYVAKLIADEVLPGQTYQYRVLINGKPVSFDYPLEFQTQPLWMWRTEPPAFKFALGSCTYVNEERFDRPGNSYGGEYKIFNAIYAKDPDFMLWTGDNMYLREADWYTRTGFHHRYTHTRSLPEMQSLLARTHNYAVWDDHDFGPNDSDGTFIHKDLALETFNTFWGNPSAGNRDAAGIFTRFQWVDVEFWLLDNRYHRTPNDLASDCDCTILGEEQLDWLTKSLANSRASFKFIVLGGQVLNTAQVYETYMNLCPRERQYLLGQIELNDIENVVFLDGDRHHSELSRYTNNRGNVVYDLTVSPTTAGAGPREEENALRVEGTLVTQRNFGTIEVSGTRKERVAKITLFDNDGKELWTHKIKSE